MPRHCSANSRGAAIPATVRRCAAWSATTPCHCTTHSRTAGAPHPRKGRRNPRREDARLLLTRTGRRRDVRPVGAVTSVAISPVRPSSPPRHHPDHCITIPDVVETCGDGTPPRQPLCLVRTHVSGTLESSRGRPSNEQPLRHPPRSRSWARTGRATTPRQRQDSSGRPSTPWHCTPCLHT
jgi:hypothetical protein